VFELAVGMSLDVIFLISDASFQCKEERTLSDVPWNEIQRVVKGLLQGNTGCVLNFVGFEMKPNDKREIAAIVRASGGKLNRNTCRNAGFGLVIASSLSCALLKSVDLYFRPHR
jgi:hypothetical protein